MLKWGRQIYMGSPLPKSSIRVGNTGQVSITCIILLYRVESDPNLLDKSPGLKTLICEYSVTVIAGNRKQETAFFYTYYDGPSG